MQRTYAAHALRRLRIAKGQLGGVEKMIGRGAYCIDVIGQLAAAKQALSGIEDLVLAHHLGACAAAQMKSGQAKKAAAEIIKVYKLSKKR